MIDKVHSFVMNAVCPHCKGVHLCTFNITLSESMEFNDFKNCTHKVLDLPKIAKVANKAVSV